MRRSRPLLPLAIGFALGLALPPCSGLTAAATVLAPLLIASPLLAPVSLTAAGFLTARLTESETPADFGKEEVVEGRVETVPDRLEDRAGFLLRDDEGRHLRVNAPEPVWPLALGDRIRLAVRLQPPKAGLNPSSRDRDAAARAKGIVLDAMARESPVRTAPPSPLALLERARDRFARATVGALEPRQAALVRAIGSGDQSAVDPATMDAFARSGLIHILSVSGLHLAIVAAGLYRLIRFLVNRWEFLAIRVEPRRAAALIAIPATLFYALATGAQVPVIRSAIAAGMVFLGILIDREVDLLNTLSLAALTILAVDPGSLFDISFQLSFASMAGLALFASRLRRALPIPKKPGVPGRVLEVLLGAACASAAATIGTAPLVVFHFRRMGLLAIPANVLGVPVGSALTVVAALAALAAGIAPPLAVPLLEIAGPLATALLAVNDFFAAPSWSVLGLASPGFWGVVACYACLLGALRLRGVWRAGLAFGAIACIALPGPIRDLAARRRGGLEVVFLSVGQGDSAFLRLPDGSAVLVDAGGELNGRYDPGAREVLPFLRDAGVRRLAAVFISHPHPDHILGLPAIAESLPIEHLFTNGRIGEGMESTFERLPRPEPLVAGDVWTRAGVRFEVLGPPRESRAWGDNDTSLVLKVSYAKTSLLFPGDIEAEGEQALPSDLKVDVVKVPHHGSKKSSGPSFVNATRPRWAVISLSSTNRFGFPNSDVVARWKQSGAETLRTDEGAIRFLSDGQSIRRVDADGAVDAVAIWRERASGLP